jgi:ABC-type lipoprotein release transport system permease subunit
MLLKLAWRNIWRNSRRSMIILLSVIVGLVAIVLYDSISIGMIRQMLDNQIGAHVSHIQIHKKGFSDNKIIQNYIPDPEKVESAVKNNPHIQHYCKRVITFGIVSSAISSSGVSLIGIDPEEEEQVTKIKKSIIEGGYLSGKKHEIVIGEKLAEKLEVGVGDKVVAMASALSGNIGSDMFRVVGIYRTFSSEFDKTHIYISLPNAREMLELENNVSEFAIIIDNLDQQQQVKSRLEDALNENYEVLTYKELLPLLVMQVDVYQESIFIFYAIIAVAMIFGIINTMLMSVFERIQEFGVLMAVGMKNRRLFWMILLEAFFLGALGTGIGFVFSYLLYLPLSNSGIDLSAFSDSLTSFGAGTTIYPVLTVESIFSALLIIPFIAVLGAVYPAFKAVRLEPMSAIRYV